jgi:hypothetical protein
MLICIQQNELYVYVPFSTNNTNTGLVWTVENILFTFFAAAGIV